MLVGEIGQSGLELLARRLVLGCVFFALFVYHSASHVMYSMPVRTVWTFLISPVMTRPAYMLPSVASSQPGTMMGRFFSQAASIQEFFGSIW